MELRGGFKMSFKHQKTKKDALGVNIDPNCVIFRQKVEGRVVEII